MGRMIADIHSHMLPGVDDGSQDHDTSMRMLEIAGREGIGRMFLTPHYVRGRNRYEPGSLPARFEEFRSEASERFPEIELYLGNEIYYSPGILDDLRQGLIETMADSRYVLVEFGPGDPFKKIYQAAREITNGGYRMIVAHVERYRCLVKKPDRLIILEDMGVYFQTNATALVKGDSRDPSQVSRWSRKMVTDGWIRFLGSDAHDGDARSPRAMDAAKWIQKKNHVSAEGILWINSQAILEDKLL